MSSVRPSGAAFTTASVATLPPVPVRLSTINSWPVRSDSDCAMQARNDVRRAVGGEPDHDAHWLRWIAVVAHAKREMAGAAAALAASRTKVRRGSVIRSSLVIAQCARCTLMFPERFSFQNYIAACREGRVKKTISDGFANRLLITSAHRD